MRWERFGEDWIDMQFTSKMHNIFILEKTEEGTILYCFDDGPEIPTESVYLEEKEDEKLRSGIKRIEKTGSQAVCEFLFDYFPGIRDHWKNNYGVL
jgi:hypothetical protein